MDTLTSGPELGLLIRTDYTDDEAWKKCLQGLMREEAMAWMFERMRREMAEGLEDNASKKEEDVDMDDGDDDEEGEDAEEEDEDEDEEMEKEEEKEEPRPPIFKPIAHDPSLLSDLSNLALLRLFNDVSVHPAPSSKTIKVSSTLSNHLGYQESYTGKRIWVYDAESNVDGYLRVVEPGGDVTGDSWRAKAAHVSELQVNLSTGALQKIDFGGLDKWDPKERKRNLEEAALPISTD
jgi:hypothetical protein